MQDYFFYKNKTEGPALALKEIIFGKDFQCEVCDYNKKNIQELAERIEILIQETPIFVLNEGL